MNEPCDTRSDDQLQFLRELLEEGASIDGDVFEIAEDTWIVHGVAGYDGEIPMAVFDTYDEAKHVLDQALGPWGSEQDGVPTAAARPSLRRDEAHRVPR